MYTAALIVERVATVLTISDSVCCPIYMLLAVDQHTDVFQKMTK
jgi:hypothetical protein